MSPVGKRVLPSTFIHRPPITTTKALSAAQFVKRCGEDVRHGPPARRRGSPRPRLLQPPCWTSPQCCFATIVGVSARCASRLCDVAVADSGSQCNWPRGVGTRERRQRWWVQCSRRSLCEDVSFVAPWCHAASIAFGFSGAFVRAAPGICCGSRIQFHLARGKLRL